MIFVLLTMIALALGLTLTIVLLLADFAVASRTDALRTPADTGNRRRARRLSGMYVRGGTPERPAMGAESDTDPEELLTH